MKAVIRHPSLRWILVAIVGYCFLILATTVEAKHKSPHSAPISADTVVGRIVSPTAQPDGSRDSITLMAGQGSICPPDAKRAVYFVSKTKESIEGCYVIVERVVHFGFVDGDYGSLPMERFTWGGQAPQVAPPSSNNKPGVGPGRDTNGTPRREVPIEATRGGAKDARWM